MLRKILMVTAATAVMTGSALSQEAKSDIVDTAVDAGKFSTLVAAVKAAGLAETLKGDGPFTVFAPTDAAFQAALEALGVSAEDLLGNTALLNDVLLYHVVPGAFDAASVVALDGTTLEAYTARAAALRPGTGPKGPVAKQVKTL